jgi:flagellar biogenesis protein FliO
MLKVLLTAAAMLMPALAVAQETGASKPVETASMVYVAMFGLLFFGMIAYFFVRLWQNEKRTKEAPTQA